MPQTVKRVLSQKKVAKLSMELMNNSNYLYNEVKKHAAVLDILLEYLSQPWWKTWGARSLERFIEAKKESESHPEYPATQTQEGPKNDQK